MHGNCSSSAATDKRAEGPRADRKLKIAIAVLTRMTCHGTAGRCWYQPEIRSMGHEQFAVYLALFAVGRGLARIGSA